MFKSIIAITLIATFFFLPPETALLDELPPAPGTIEFIGDAGSPNIFTFENWGFTKVEKADDPENIKIEAVFDVRSLKCEWKELEQSVLKKKDYFFAKKFPEARLSIDGATATGSGEYTAEALLTLKGISKTIELVFTISEEAPYMVHAEGVVERRLFKFNGDGPKDEVPVRVDAVLEAGRKN
ncbi:MAG: YceI family protein [Lewinellaceae bacterium]|nr:YceI family protein [Phaeodactylibacter sp.]MCB9041069.1 YceI family protein [Lewinellaceae bacterium]